MIIRRFINPLGIGLTDNERYSLHFRDFQLKISQNFISWLEIGKRREEKRRWGKFSSWKMVTIGIWHFVSQHQLLFTYFNQKIFQLENDCVHWAQWASLMMIEIATSWKNNENYVHHPPLGFCSAQFVKCIYSMSCNYKGVTCIQCKANQPKSCMEGSLSSAPRLAVAAPIITLNILRSTNNNCLYFTLFSIGIASETEAELILSSWNRTQSQQHIVVIKPLTPFQCN